MSFKNKYLKYKSKYLQLQSDNTLAKIINEKYQLGGADSASVNTDNLIKFIEENKVNNDRITQNKYFVMLYGPPRDGSPTIHDDDMLKLGILDIITYEQHFGKSKELNNLESQYPKIEDLINIIKKPFFDTRLTSKDVDLLNPTLKESIEKLIKKLNPEQPQQSATLTTSPVQQGGFPGMDELFKQATTYIATSDTNNNAVLAVAKRKEIDTLVNLLVTLGFYLNKNVYYELYLPSHFDYYILLCKMFDYIPIIIYNNVTKILKREEWETRLTYPNNSIRFFDMNPDYLLKHPFGRYNNFRNINKDVKNESLELFCDNISLCEIEDNPDTGNKDAKTLNTRYRFIERYQRYESNKNPVNKLYKIRILDLKKNTFESKIYGV